MGKKKQMMPEAATTEITWLCEELRLGIEKKWPYNACVIFGQLLEAVGISTSSFASSVITRSENQLKELLFLNTSLLESQIAERADHVGQIISSECGLSAEEFVQFCAYLSDWIALHAAFTRLGLPTGLIKPLPPPEAIRSYLSRSDHEHPASWIRKALLLREPSRHWWWRVHEQSN